jgi:hypothetical protein
MKKKKNTQERFDLPGGPNRRQPFGGVIPTR